MSPGTSSVPARCCSLPSRITHTSEVAIFLRRARAPSGAGAKRLGGNLQFRADGSVESGSWVLSIAPGYLAVPTHWHDGQRLFALGQWHAAAQSRLVESADQRTAAVSYTHL